MNRENQGARRRARPATTGWAFVGSPPWRSLIVPLVLVAVVVGASLGARGGQSPTPAEPSASTRIVLSRSLSCVHDVAKSSARAGTVPSSGGSSLSPSGRITLPPSAAAAGYATQWATGKGWIAARSCPSPADDWWFVGAGAGVAHRSYLTLDNPRSNDANVTITVFGPRGQVQAPGLSGLLVPAGRSLRLDLESIAPALGDLTVHVSAERGLVAASLWEKWAVSAVSSSVYSWVPAAPAPATDLQLLGVPGKLTHAALIVSNPGSVSAVVKVRVVNASGTFAPTRNAMVTVAPSATTVIAMDAPLKVGLGSVIVSSSIPVTAGLRATRGSAESYATPAVRLATQSTVGLQGGLPATLVLTAPSADSVEVTAVDARGRVVLSRAVAIPAAQTVGIALPKAAVALRVVGDHHSAVSGALVVDNGSIAVIGLAPTGSAARVPEVTAQQY